MALKTALTDINKAAVAIDKMAPISPSNYSGLGTVINDLTAKQAALALSTKALNQTRLEELIEANNLIEKYGAEALIKAGLLSEDSSLLATEKAVNVETLKKTLITKGLTDAQAENLIQQYLTTSANGAATASTVQLNKAMMEEAIQKGLLSSESAQEILNIYGIIAAEKAETASKKSLTLATWEQVKSQIALMASNPITWITVLVGMIHLAKKAWDYFNVTVEESKEKVDNITSSLSELNDEIQTLTEKSELTDMEKKRLEYLEMRAKLEERLLEVEKQRYAQELLGSPNKLTDWFDDDNYLSKASKEFGNIGLFNTSDSASPLSSMLTMPLGKFVINKIDSMFHGADAVINKGGKVSQKIQTEQDNLRRYEAEQQNYDVDSIEYGENQQLIAATKKQLVELVEKDAVDAYGDLLNKYGQYLNEQEAIREQLETDLTSDDREVYEKLLEQYVSKSEAIRDTINELAVLTGNPDMWIDSGIDFSSWDDAEQYFKENIMPSLGDMDGSGLLANTQVMFDVQTRWNNGEITAGEYQKKLQEFQDSMRGY